MWLISRMPCSVPYFPSSNRTCRRVNTHRQACGFPAFGSPSVSTATCFQSGPFVPQALPRFLTTMDLSDSRGTRPNQAHPWLCLPQEWWNLFPTCRASQVPVHRFLCIGSSTDLSVRAGLNHPGEPDNCLGGVVAGEELTTPPELPAPSSSVLGFTISGRLATLT